MSVVPMQKVRFVVYESDADRLLSILQRHTAMEFVEVDAPETSAASVSAPHHELYPRVQHATHFLQSYEAKVGLWKTLREGVATNLTETEVEKKTADTDAVESIVSDLEQLQVEMAEVNESVRKLSEQHKLLAEWKNLPIRIADFETKTTKTVLVYGIVGDESLEARVIEGLNESGIAYALTVVDSRHIAVTIPKTAITNTDFQHFIESLGGHVAEIVEGVETPEVEFAAVSEQLAKAKGDLGLLHDQAEHFAITHLKTLRIAAEILSWEHARYATRETARATTHTVVLDGWLNAGKRADIESEITEKGIAAVLQERELAEGEEPPVDIENNAFIQPFEAVTRLYGMPGYKDLDPTLFLAGFFFLFFGLSLTDVGYGLTLMVLSAMILTLFKVSDAIKMFAKLLLFVGFATVLVGMLFGGYLGIDPTLLPAPLQAIQLFDPIANPLPVFYLALGLGVFQVMVGMIIKIYSEYRNGRLLTGILDEGPWLFMFCVGILYLAVITGYISGITTGQVVNLAYVGLVMVILSSGRNGKGIFGKIMASASALYNSIGYFSDILSYSRLLALGLATTALAFAVNLIAGIVAGSMPFIGPIFAVIILFIGHVFTLAVNTLGAFIHSARLQFVEFFGKFIAGTGREFRPLSRSKKYVSIRDD